MLNAENRKDRIYPKDMQSVKGNHLQRYLFAVQWVEKLGANSVLDAACGVGYGSKMLRDVAQSVIGIDADEGAIAHAKHYFPGPDYRCMNIATWRGTADCVVSLETIEHLPDPLAVLLQFRSSRNLILSVPNEDKIRWAADTFDGQVYPHFRHYTSKQLDELLSESGWTVESRWSQKSKNEPTIYPNLDGDCLVYVCS